MENPNGKKLLVVDDEPDICNLIVFNAEQAGYDVSAVYSGENALDVARKEKPDLIVLDLMLPGIGGLDVCRILKNDKATSNIPIIILTAKGTEEDIVKGLELGADDYVTKPFSPRVLLARIKSVLRRNGKKGDNAENITYREIQINPGKREVKINGKPAVLTFSEFEILHYLVRHRGWVFTRTEIVNNIRGDNYLVTERAVDVLIVGLRKKLGEAAKYIETVRGVGYRFKDE
jgi:two-component system phosphate regulon response regulator PhoB